MSYSMPTFEMETTVGWLFIPSLGGQDEPTCRHQTVAEKSWYPYDSNSCLPDCHTTDLNDWSVPLSLNFQFHPRQKPVSCTPSAIPSPPYVSKIFKSVSRKTSQQNILSSALNHSFPGICIWLFFWTRNWNS